MIIGFEAGDILQGINMLLEQIASNRSERLKYNIKVVRKEGNPNAVALINEYFEPCDAYWRGIGTTHH